eukprot:1959567-Pleurochrysis_carterae.AAC.1
MHTRRQSLRASHVRACCSRVAAVGAHAHVRSSTPRPGCRRSPCPATRPLPAQSGPTCIHRIQKAPKARLTNGSVDLGRD